MLCSHYTNTDGVDGKAEQQGNRMQGGGWVENRVNRAEPQSLADFLIVLLF